MKQRRFLYTVMAFLLMLTAITAQKAPGKVKAKVEVPDEKVDTIKVRIFFYADTDGSRFIEWRNGYLIHTTKFEQTSEVTAGNEKALTIKEGKVGINTETQVLTDEKYVLLKDTNIADVKAFAWK